MNNLILILKGFIIGIGKIIPGVSGAVLAISLGVYEKGIDAIIHIFNKKNILFLFYLGIGFMISVVTMSNLVIYLMNNYYFWIMLLFVGLIIGGLKDIVVDIKDKISIKNVICMSIPALILMFLNKNSVSVNLNYNFITIFLLGMIEALTMIVPGVSGTAIHMMLGSYDYVMNMFANIIIKDLFVFGLGMIVFTIVFIKLISYTLKRYKVQCYYIILGFTISSILFLITTLNYNNSILEYIIGFVIFLIGIKISDKLSS